MLTPKSSQRAPLGKKRVGEKKRRRVKLISCHKCKVLCLAFGSSAICTWCRSEGIHRWWATQDVLISNSDMSLDVTRNT